MKKVVVIGGGTGNFSVLSGLKKYPYKITAVINMADNGGSTGILRDELGVLPPGDIRQCLVALSRFPKMRDLFNYRFEEGSLAGHSFGNFFLTALEKVTGSFEEAVKEASKILKIKGEVLPVTYDPVCLYADLGRGGVIKGETQVGQAQLWKFPQKRLYIKPFVRLNPKVKSAMAAADLIVIAPGSLYCSLLPTLLVKGMSEALRKSQAKVLYISNLVNKPNETNSYDLADYINELEKISKRKIDLILFNSKKPQNAVMKKYLKQHELPVKSEGAIKSRIIKADLLSEAPITSNRGDIFLQRSFIRHDPEKVGNAIKKLLDES